MNGISRYLGVMPPWIFRHVIAAHGCPVSPLGPTLKLQGHNIEAAFIDVSPSVLETVRRHTGMRETLHDPGASPLVAIQHPLSPPLAHDDLSCATEQSTFSGKRTAFAGLT
jgi:acyl homoserine lactone synthase